MLKILEAKRENYKGLYIVKIISVNKETDIYKVNEITYGYGQIEAKTTVTTWSDRPRALWVSSETSYNAYNSKKQTLRKVHC